MSSTQPPSIGRYEILGRLGEGGMGEVYLARDPVIERQIALKLLREGIENDDLRQRFIREARSAGRLQHVNIVVIFDVGEHLGRPYIAMEYVEGQTLADLVRRREPLPVPRKLRLLEQLCEGLGYAHRAGIVHRDIKPANLIVSKEGVLKILDFGIARLGQAAFTRAGVMLGTLNYMSPEQVTGAEIDSRSDIFAVGAVCYEFLSNTRAFPGNLQDRILERILSRDPPALDGLCPGIHPRVVAIVNKALEKAPASRYQDLESLRLELAAVRESLSVPTSPGQPESLPPAGSEPVGDAKTWLSPRPAAGPVSTPPASSAARPRTAAHQTAEGPPAALSPAVEAPPAEASAGAPSPVPRTIAPQTPSLPRPVAAQGGSGRKRGTLAIAGLLLAVALVAGGIYAWSRFQGSAPASGDAPAVARPIQSEAPVPPAEPASGDVPSAALPPPPPATEPTAPSESTAAVPAPAATGESIPISPTTPKTPPTEPAAGPAPEPVKPSPPAPQPARPSPTVPQPVKSPPASQPVKPSPPPAAPAPRGTLVVDSDTPGAVIYVDERLLGTVPVRSSALEPGEHTLRATLEGEDDITRIVDIRPPDETSVFLRFQDVRLRVSIPVVHKHASGSSCAGRLSATTAGLTYETTNRNDVFSLLFPEVERFQMDLPSKTLTVKQQGGRTWNFTDHNPRPEDLVRFHRLVTRARERLAAQRRR